MQFLKRQEIDRKRRKGMGGSKMEEETSSSVAPSAAANRRDPYEVLNVSRDSSDQEIKSAYRKLALKLVSVSFLSF